MKLLCLETATSAAAVALVVDGVRIAEEIPSTQRHHTETLMASVASILDAAGMSLRSLDGIVVDIGPGLFTGLRVGLATARSLAATTEVALYCTTSLEALAADPRAHEFDSVLSVVDARRGEVFVQAFGGSVNGVRESIGAPALVTPEILAAMGTQLVGSAALVGDGALRYAAMVSGVTVIEDVIVPSPASAGVLVERDRRAPVDPMVALPLYLRDPDAVANFTVAAQVARLTPNGG
ncbi:MAG: tRNA (adenosine(37)-N6)-threonylcarbamoyltransferase complex dimerization subunit type 1 TsaB [Actinomycetes bacterium]